MDKLSSEQIQEVLSEAPLVIQKLAQERDYYKQKLAEQLGEERVTKLAQAMIDKGLEDGDVASVTRKIASALQSGKMDLEVTEQAVAMVGPDMGKLASVGDDLSPASGATPLEQFIMS